MESGSPHAKYAILSKVDDVWQIEHVLIPYDWEMVARVARSNGRLDWATWLTNGRV